MVPVESIICDAEQTFGECFFMGYDGDKTEKNEVDQDVVTARRYNIFSKGQNEIVRIHVPINVPKIDMPRKTPCKVVGELRRKFIPGNVAGMENVTFCMVDNIVRDPASAGSAGNGQPNKQQKAE